MLKALCDISPGQRVQGPVVVSSVSANVTLSTVFPLISARALIFSAPLDPPALIRGPALIGDPALISFIGN